MTRASVESAASELAATIGPRGRLTILTGAGISADSGVPTFRDAGGVWEAHSLEDLATPEGFARDPRKVLAFYNARRRALHDVMPNDAHRALARLESALGERFALITQNIDDLHERGGSRRVWHLHGELLKARCGVCGVVLEWPGDLRVDDACEVCAGPLRPHVVWFGEVPFGLDDVIPDSLRVEAFLSIGSSGTVYPAAGFVAAARELGARTFELNLEPSENAASFDHQLVGRAAKLLPQLVEVLLELLATR